MTEKSQSQIDGFQKHGIFKIPRFILISGVLLFPLLVMAACSWVPDELDVTSYLWGDDTEEYILDSSSSNILAENTASSIDSSSDLFDDDPDAWLESDDDFPILSNEDDFPNDKLKNTNSASVEEGLLAERATSRYTDTTLRSRYAEGPTDEKWNEDPYTEPLVVISEDQDIKSLDQNISRPKSKSSAGIIVNVEEIERLRANNSHLEDSSNLPNEIDQFRSTFNERFLASGGLGSSNKLDSKVTDFSNDIHDNQIGIESDKSGADQVQSDPLLSPTISFLAGTIHFGTGSSKITAADRSKLKNISSLNNELGGVIKVVGHASSRTRDLDIKSREIANLNISQKRAKAVAKVLVKHGVLSKQMEVIAVADKELIAHEYMPSGERENQRAEVYIEY